MGRKKGGQMIRTLTAYPRWSVYVIYAAVFVSFLEFHSLLPLIAPYARSLGASVGWVGLIVGAYSAVNGLGNLGAGYWIDRIGRKIPLCVGLGIVGGALLLYPLATHPSVLLVLRLIHGLGAALMSPASLAYVGDRASPQARGRAMALYGATIGLAVLMAPPLAGLIRDHLGYGYVFRILAALMFLVLIAAYLLIGESLPKTAERGDVSRWHLLRHRRLLLAYSSAFFLTFALGNLIVFLPLQGQDLGLSSAHIGLLFASFALAAMIIQMSPLGRISDRWGREPALVLGLGLIAVALLLLPGLHRWEMLMGAIFSYGLGFGVLFPAMTALMVDATEPQTRGTASGIFTAIFSLGAAMGTSLAGVLAWLQQAVHLHPFQTVALLVLVEALWVGVNWIRR